MGPKASSTNRAASRLAPAATSARKVSQAFDTLYRLHKMLGGTFRVSWDVYRQELVETYEIDGSVLDALNRLGHFRTAPNSVRFAGL